VPLCPKVDDKLVALPWLEMRDNKWSSDIEEQ